MLKDYLTTAYQCIEEFAKENEEFADFILNPTVDNWCRICPWDSNYSTNFGETKGVLIPNDEDFVIKFPFIKNHIDYCMIETYNSNQIVEAGLGDCIAQEIYGGYYENARWYIQEWVDCDEDEISCKIEDSCYKVFNDTNDGDPNDEDYDEDYGGDDYEEDYFRLMNRLVMH